MCRLVMLFMLSKTIFISYFIMLNPLLPLMAISLHPGMRLPFASVSYFRPSLILVPGLIVPMPVAVPSAPVRMKFAVMYPVITSWQIKGIIGWDTDYE
jgi:hypothetical protein